VRILHIFSTCTKNLLAAGMWPDLLGRLAALPKAPIADLREEWDQGWNCRGVGGFNPPSKFFDSLLIIACYRLSTSAAYGQPPSYFLAIPTLSGTQGTGDETEKVRKRLEGRMRRRVLCPVWQCYMRLGLLLEKCL